MNIKDAYEELKAVAPKDKYISLDYSMSRYAHGGEDIDCSVYIEDAGIFAAGTFKMALDQAKEALGLIKPDELNIEG